MFQKGYEMSWRFKDSIKELREKNFAEFRKLAGRLPIMFASYVIGVAAVEELVTPLWDDEAKSWGQRAGRWLVALGRSQSASWIGLRQMYQDVLWGREGTGQGSTLEAAENVLVRPIRALMTRKGLSEEQLIKFFTGLISASGIIWGVGNEQARKATEYLWRYHRGMERPRGMPDWLHGLQHGTGKPIRRRMGVLGR